MRPLQLKFAAFGSYPEANIIDFTKMINSKMFIISGMTGSGKTTVFDAMTFALYGSASGSMRSSEMFRSDFANDDIFTEVTFDFQIDSKQYSITRSPSQYRPKKRGDGYTKSEAVVCLQYDDEVLTNHLEVAKCIEQIIGLNKDQFKQIVLLPQGEFKKLLTSDSKSKEEIFRKIFNTSHIKSLQESMRVETSGLQRLIEDSSLKIETILGGYKNITTTNQIRNFKQATKLNVGELTTHINCLKVEVEQLKKQLGDEQLYKQQLILLEENIQKLSQLKQDKPKYEEYRQFINSYKQVLEYKQAKTALSNSKQSLENDAEQLADKNKQLELNLVSINQIEKQLNALTVDYNNLDNKRNELSEIKLKLGEIAKIEVTLSKIEAYNTSIDQLQQLLANNTKLVAQSEQLLKRDIESEKVIENLNKQVVNLNNDLVSNKTKFDAADEVEKLESKLIKSKQKYNQLNTQLDDANNMLATYRKQYLDNQVGEIAKTLIDQAPCPVCGSTNHPNPGLVTNSDITIELIEAQEAIVQSLNSETNKLINQTETNRALISQITEQNNLEDIDYKQISNKIVINIEKIEVEIKRLSTDCDVEVRRSTVDRMKKQVTDNQSELKSLQILLEESKEQVQSVNIDEVYKKQLKDNSNQLANYIKQVETDYIKFKDNHNKLIQSKISIEKDIESQSVSITKEEAVINKLNDVISSITSEYSEDVLASYLEMLTNEQDIRAKLTNYDNVISITKSKIAELQTIKDSHVDVDCSSLETKLQGKQQSLSSYEELYDLFNATLIRLEIDEKLLNDIESKNKSTLDRYNIVRAVSDIANGKTISKISFERYMLSIFFKQIISRANIYFQTMTNNRFLLEYKKPTGGRTVQGLDLDIIDSYTTKVRDVKSLSGGESFKAALALALGLSDIVQMNSGGIKIETIFIDEGFGSLDSDSLSSAIDTLINIESEGRMVGIISHVEELKNQVSNKVLVTTSPSGSKLTTNFN